MRGSVVWEPRLGSALQICWASLWLMCRSNTQRIAGDHERRAPGQLVSEVPHSPGVYPLVHIDRGPVHPSVPYLCTSLFHQTALDCSYDSSSTIRHVNSSREGIRHLGNGQSSSNPIAAKNAWLSGVICTSMDQYRSSYGWKLHLSLGEEAADPFDVVNYDCFERLGDTRMLTATYSKGGWPIPPTHGQSGTLCWYLNRTRGMPQHANLHHDVDTMLRNAISVCQAGR